MSIVLKPSQRSNRPRRKKVEMLRLEVNRLLLFFASPSAEKYDAPKGKQILLCRGGVGDSLQEAGKGVRNQDGEDEFNWCIDGSALFDVPSSDMARKGHLTLIGTSAELVGQVDECWDEEQRQSMVPSRCQPRGVFPIRLCM
jgi:hypothetical protein